MQRQGQLKRSTPQRPGPPSSVGALFAGYMNFPRPRDVTRYRYSVRCSLVIQRMEMFQDDCEMLAAGSLLRKTDEVSLLQEGGVGKGQEKWIRIMSALVGW